jgi:hypothetical protein
MTKAVFLDNIEKMLTECIKNDEGECLSFLGINGADISTGSELNRENFAIEFKSLVLEDPVTNKTREINELSDDDYYLYDNFYCKENERLIFEDGLYIWEEEQAPKVLCWHFDDIVEWCIDAHEYDDNSIQHEDKEFLVEKCCEIYNKLID